MKRGPQSECVVVNKQTTVLASFHSGTEAERDFVARTREREEPTEDLSREAECGL